MSDLSSDSEERSNQEIYSSDSEDEQLTTQNKRVKLAEEYLSTLNKEDIDDTLNSNLLESSNKLNKFISDRVAIDSVKSIKQRLPLTNSVLTQPNNERILVFSSKDNTLHQQHLSTRQKHGCHREMCSASPRPPTPAGSLLVPPTRP